MAAGGMVMAFCLIVIALRAPWPVEFVNFMLLGFGFYLLHGCIQVYVTELAPAARGSATAGAFGVLLSRAGDRAGGLWHRPRQRRHRSGAAGGRGGAGGDRLGLRDVAAAAAEPIFPNLAVQSEFMKNLLRARQEFAMIAKLFARVTGASHGVAVT